MEEWKEIPNYRKYEISSYGRVKNIETGRILKPQIGRSGYLKVTLYDKSWFEDRDIHRMVAEAFIPNPDNLPIVNHLDEIITNNWTNNLEWTTHQGNIEHSKAKHYTLISPDGEVINIFNMRKFCRKYNLSSGAMIAVTKGKRKQHKGWRIK